MALLHISQPCHALPFALTIRMLTTTLELANQYARAIRLFMQTMLQ